MVLFPFLDPPSLFFLRTEYKRSSKDWWRSQTQEGSSTVSQTGRIQAGGFTLGQQGTLLGLLGSAGGTRGYDTIAFLGSVDL